MIHDIASIPVEEGFETVIVDGELTIVEQDPADCQCEEDLNAVPEDEIMVITDPVTNEVIETTCAEPAVHVP